MGSAALNNVEHCVVERLIEVHGGGWSARMSARKDAEGKVDEEEKRFFFSAFRQDETKTPHETRRDSGVAEQLDVTSRTAPLASYALVRARPCLCRALA